METGTFDGHVVFGVTDLHSQLGMTCEASANLLLQAGAAFAFCQGTCCTSTWDACASWCCLLDTEYNTVSVCDCNYSDCIVQQLYDISHDWQVKTN